MTWVHSFDADPAFLRFVDCEGIELRKGPAMQSPLVVIFLALANLGSVAYVRQILEDDGTARGSMLHKTFCQNVVHVPVEMGLPPRQLFQVSLSGL